VILKRLMEGEAAVAEVIARARRYADAGADGFFAPGVSDAATIRELAGAISLPLNIMGWAGVPKAAELAALGVRRLSSATMPFRLAYAAQGAAIQVFLADGDSDALAGAGAGAPNFNGWFAR
jgi:2-methylisocitrate lyase-like PEP mutase family enzyme